VCWAALTPQTRNTGRLHSSAQPACPTTPTPSVVTSNPDRELVACTPKVPLLTGTAAFDKPHPPKSVRRAPSYSANQPPDHRGEKPRLTCGESTVLRFPPTMRTRGTEWPRVDRLLERVRHTCASSIEHDPNQLQKPRRVLRWPKPQRATPAHHHHQRSRGSGASSPGPGTLADARYHAQPSAACSTASCQRRSHGTSDRTGHRDGVSRSGWLHAPAVATVLVFEYHVAGRGPVPGRLPVMNP
jgi:hypothetical protein